MVEVVFVFRGRTVELDEVEDVRERAALRQIEKSIRERIGGLSCPEHAASPRVTATGSQVDSMEFDLAGCCDRLLQMTVRCFE
ncbi:MAG: hypothetical protein ACE5FL_11530 [Myxococcota bacterium]